MDDWTNGGFLIHPEVSRQSTNQGDSEEDLPSWLKESSFRSLEFVEHRTTDLQRFQLLWSLHRQIFVGVVVLSSHGCRTVTCADRHTDNSFYILS